MQTRTPLRTEYGVHLSHSECMSAPPGQYAGWTLHGTVLNVTYCQIKIREYTGRETQRRKREREQPILMGHLMESLVHCEYNEPPELTTSYVLFV